MSLFDFTSNEIPIVLNRFFVKELNESDLTVYEYSCSFQENPEPGQEQRAIASLCYKLGVTAVRFGSKIITKDAIASDRLQGDGWTVSFTNEKVMDCSHSFERKGIEQLQRRILEKSLIRRWNKTSIEKASEGGLIWWVTGEEGTEKCGEGWEVHKGRRIDVNINSDGKLYLEIDLHHRFYTPWTLHEWQDKYPESPITYVRNTYKDGNNRYISWLYEDVSDELPDQFVIEGLDKTLADYHRENGATEEEVKKSRVILVKRDNSRKDELIGHLSRRLSPSLTMEMLANVAEQSESEEKKNVQEVFDYVKRALDIRLKESTKTAKTIAEEVYGVFTPPKPSVIDGYILPGGKLFAKKGQVEKTGNVRYKGCVKVGETKFGCLNLFNNVNKYPDEVEKCLKEVATNSGTEIDYANYKTQNQLPQKDLERQAFWHEWANTGIKTILVVTRLLPKAKKREITVEALQAGIVTRFMLAEPKANAYKAINVVLSLLCKAGWQTVRLQPVEHPDAAELIIGFDTGTNKELYYGTSAFAILADGQSLGWELPNIQRGERFSGEAVWQVVSKLLLRFRDRYNRYPKRLLLMRDGLVQEGEFEQTIKALEEQGIALDIVGVRKSGAGRMGCEVTQGSEKVYRDAPVGSVVFMPKDDSFLMITSQPLTTKKNQVIGSARPLRVVRYYGSASLELLALQTYHLTQLHPASAFSSARLPWVLHLADKSSKEFQRIRQINILQNIDREKLIGV